MSIFATAVLITAIAMYAFGALTTVAAIGKDRKPITPGVAVGTVIVSALMITQFALILAGR